MRMAIEHDAIAETILQRLPESITESLDMLHRSKVLRLRGRCPEPNGEQRALRPGTAAQLMTGAVD